MSNSIAPGSSADVNIKVTALTTNPNVPATYKTIILKKNLVNGVNTLMQEMMSAINTKYMIKYDYVLGENIIVPNGCILEFDGGSISGNGTNKDTINLNACNINSNPIVIFSNIKLSGNYNNYIYADWFDNLNDCIDSLSLSAYNIKLLKKSYIINKTIILPDNSSIEGVQKEEWLTTSNKTVIQVSDTFVDDAVIVLGTNDTTNHNIKLSNFCILSNNNAKGVVLSDEIYGVTIDNVYVKGATTAFEFSTFWTTRVKDCISYSSTYGFHVGASGRGGTTSSIFTKCVVFGGDIAFYITNSLNSTSFINCAIDGSKNGFVCENYFKSLNIDGLSVEQFSESAIILNNNISSAYISNLSIGSNSVTEHHIIDIQNALSVILINCNMPSGVAPKANNYYNLNFGNDSVAKVTTIISSNITNATHVVDGVTYNNVNPDFDKAIHISNQGNIIKWSLNEATQTITYPYGQDTVTKKISSKTVILTPEGESRILKATPIFTTNALNGTIFTCVNYNTIDKNITLCPEGEYYGNTGYIGPQITIGPNQYIKLLYTSGKFYKISEYQSNA